MHTVKHHCSFGYPGGDDCLFNVGKAYGSATNHGSKYWLCLVLQIAHPSAIARLAHDLGHDWAIFGGVFSLGMIKQTTLEWNDLFRTFFKEIDQPDGPYILLRVDGATAEDAFFCHRGLHREEETENQEGCGNPHSEAGRLLQKSEESRHAFTVQRHQEVTARTGPSHRRGDCTATRTRSNNPEDAS